MLSIHKSIMAQSSATYHKFTVEREEVEEKTPRSRSVLPVLILALVAVALVVASVAIGVGVGVATQGTEPSIGLTVSANSRGELRGEYHDSSGGILFHVIVSNSSINLTITTSSDEPVVHILHSLKSSMTMMAANRTNFLVMENQPGREKFADYVIPAKYVNLIESMVMTRDNMSEDILQLLDNRTVNATRQSSLENLAMRKEALLIIAAAKTLEGQITGRKGTEFPAVKVFYLLGYQLAEARGSTNAESGMSAPRSEVPEKPKQKRRIQCDEVNGGDVCEPNACPFRRNNNNCFGMCGRRCFCWRFICGNCCVHQFCLTHDQCCADRGFFSWACLSVVWRVLGSRCSDTFNC